MRKNGIRLEAGQRYGNWTVEAPAYQKHNRTFYTCRCDCGAARDVDPYTLVKGFTTHCGCGGSSTPLRRFWGRVKASADGCWVWIGNVNPYGYGMFSNGKTLLAHRWIYEQLVGPIPEGEHLDHLCRNRACVNPAHLEPVTPRENTLRSERRNQYSGRTHCRNRHEYTPENTFTVTHTNGKTTRGCKSCRTAHKQRANVRLQEKRRGGASESGPAAGRTEDPHPADRSRARCRRCRAPQEVLRAGLIADYGLRNGRDCQPPTAPLEIETMSEKKIAPAPWHKDAYGRLYDADGDRIMVNGVSLPAGVHPDSERADAHRDLFLAAPDLLDALTEVLATGLNGGNNVRLAFIAASQQVLSDEDMEKAEASERAVIKARAAIKKAAGDG